MTAKFLFVDYLPPNAPTRAKELADSVSRSHAAKVSHQKTSEKRRRFSTGPSSDRRFITPTSTKSANLRLSGPHNLLAVHKGYVTLTEREKSALEEASEEQLAIWARLDQHRRQKMLTGSPNRVDSPLILDLDHVNTLCKDLQICLTWSYLKLF